MILKKCKFDLCQISWQSFFKTDDDFWHWYGSTWHKKKLMKSWLFFTVAAVKEAFFQKGADIQLSEIDVYSNDCVYTSFIFNKISFNKTYEISLMVLKSAG